MHVRAALLSLLLLAVTSVAHAEQRQRAREAGITFGILAPGPLNAITDVAGVKVGHVTLIEGKAIRTGVTAILPHGGNLYQDKLPAGFAVGNAYGKFMGSTQIKELGEIETPILLTNTLNVPEAAAECDAYFAELKDELAGEEGVDRHPGLEPGPAFPSEEPTAT